MFRVESNRWPIELNVARVALAPVRRAATQFLKSAWYRRPRWRPGRVHVPPMDADWLLKHQIKSYKQGDDI